MRKRKVSFPCSSGPEAALFVVFAPERGVLSEHRSLDEAVAAYMSELDRENQPPPPAIYQRTDRDWKRVKPGAPVQPSAQRSAA